MVFGLWSLVFGSLFFVLCALLSFQQLRLSFQSLTSVQRPKTKDLRPKTKDQDKVQSTNTSFMLISYNWLRELTGTDLTPTELRERLTMVGLAIDAVEEIEGDSVLDVEVPVESA